MSSCGYDNFTPNEVGPQDNLISENDALSLLRDAPDISINRGKHGRARSNTNILQKKVKKIEGILDENGATVLHVANYENGGFVILSADSRAKPILAFSETDNFPVDNDLYPTGLMEWLNHSKEYIQDIRKMNKKQTAAQAHQWMVCPLIAQLVPPGDDCDGGGGGGCVDEYEEVAPLVHTTWGQGCGYNNLTPSCNNANGNCYRAPTGCVATAMAQIMRYHGFPGTYNWAAMPNSVWSSSNPGSADISQLMRDIGDNVNMDYGCSASGADTKDEVPQTFKSDFGYATATYLDYEGTSRYENVKTEFRAGRPVVFRGGRKAGSWPIYWYADGHAWVGDGFRRTFDCATGTGYLLFHLNWGWGGLYNGWYGFNDFTPDSYTFNYKSGVVLNIRP